MIEGSFIQFLGQNGYDMSIFELYTVMNDLDHRALQEKIQKRLREQFQKLYAQKCQAFCKMLQTQHQTLKQSIEGVYKQIAADEVLGTMLNDRTTSVHIHDRIKEVFSQVIQHERELMFRKLGNQITNLKFDYELLLKENKKLKQNSSDLERNFTTERQNLERNKSQIDEQARRVKEELYRFKSKTEELTKQNYELRALLESVKQSNEQAERDTQNVRQYEIRIRQLDETVRELTSTLKENEQRFERKYQTKKKEFKQKLQSYRTLITQMQVQKQQSDALIRKAEEDNTNFYMQKKMAALVNDHDKRMSELRAARERQRSQMEKLQEVRVKEMQVYFQKLMEQKIVQIEQNTARYFEKMREEGMTLQQQLQYYEQNAIPTPQHQEEIQKRDQIITLMKKKLAQFQVILHESSQKDQALNQRIKDGDLVASSLRQKINQLEEANQNMIAKIKLFEQSNNIFKIGQIKQKEQFQQYDKVVKKIREQLEETKRMFSKSQQEKNQITISMREKDRKLKQTLQQNQIILKKIKKVHEDIGQYSKRQEGLISTVSQLKKQIVSLEYKIKDKDMTSNLNTSSWQNKNNTLQAEIKQKAHTLQDLQQKYQHLYSELQEEKQKSFQTQNSLRKLQMQSKFYKQAIQLKKMQIQASQQEQKRNINDKTQRMSHIQNELQVKTNKLKELESQMRIVRQKANSDSKRLKNKLRKMAKISEDQLETLRKSLNSIISYLQTKQAIMSNEYSVFKSTFNKELIHHKFLNDRQKEQIIKQVKSQQLQILKSQIKNVKLQHENQQKIISEKYQSQKDALRRQARQIQRQKESVVQELKGLSTNIRKANDQIRHLQQQNDSLSKRTEKQKDTYEARLKQLLKQFKDERDHIVKQYQDKKHSLQQEILNLTSSFRRLKSEAESIQANHEEEKSAIAAQLRTVRQQEQIIQRVVTQKDQQIQRILRENENLSQARRQAEGQSRSYAEALNKKIQALHDLQIKQTQLGGELNLLKNKCERITQESTQLKRKLTIKEQQLDEHVRSRSRTQSELKDIRGALSRTSKTQELRALNELSIGTSQLTEKISEMRKVSNYLDGRTPLRS